MTFKQLSFLILGLGTVLNSSLLFFVKTTAFMKIPLRYFSFIQFFEKKKFLFAIVPIDVEKSIFAVN